MKTTERKLIPIRFNTLEAALKWQIIGELMGEAAKYQWYCPKCKSKTSDPRHASPIPGASIHCGTCEFELTRRTGGGQHDPFRWYLGKIPMPKLIDLPNGTLIMRKKKLYCVQNDFLGTDKLLVDVNNGTRYRIKDFKWRSYTIIYKPRP